MNNKISSDIYLDFDDVMIQPCLSFLSSRSQVDLERTIEITNQNSLNKITWKGIPIIAANMDTVGTFEVYNVLSQFKIITAFHKFYTIEDFINLNAHGKIKLDPDYFMISTGISNENYENMVKIVEYTECKWICIDVANGYMSALLDFCKKVRNKFPDKIIVAGNIVTPEMAKLIEKAGANIVKVGIGPGSACLTRKKTGVGCPQLSAIINCSEVSSIVADGGIKHPCDLAKAFAAGAEFVMLGGVFSGHDENPGEIYVEGNEKFKLFYGMSSKHAMVKHYGGMSDYRASEGTVLKVPYKGELKNTVLDFLGGLRSACTYTNSKNLEEFKKNASFFRLK